MKSHELRRSFLRYFQGLDHLVLPSSPLVPQGDPTLLFTNAGMNQFKGVFLGELPRPAPRVATVQKCLRVSGKHNDLEEVGKDEFHHTFFEMLGNWSFADYYKREAMDFAWRYLTEELGLPKDRLWVTVHRDDHEAKALWPEVAGISPHRVLSFGDEDNFWEMGDVGPCGPCTEIHYDLGPAYGPDFPESGPNDPHHRRWIELWNLVFIQFRREPDGRLVPLAERFVDTGMGFERLLTIIQGVEGNYRTDLFQPLTARLSDLLGGTRSIHTDPVAFRAIADHIRALTFAIADGVIPSNEGRGYVVRRLLRRAARYGRTLGLEEPFLSSLSGVVVEIMGMDYPELVEAAPHIAEVIQAEEQTFAATLDRGLALFSKEVERLKGSGSTVIPGDVVFRLYDTYGFPPDLTQLMAQEQGLSVDEAGFATLMERQRALSRQEGEGEAPLGHVRGLEGGVFVGYQTLEVDTCVVGVSPPEGVAEGHEGWVVLRETPFYPEGGGQVSDVGTLTGPEAEAEVLHATRTDGGILCRVRVSRGRITPGARVRAAVERTKRLRTQAHHTATHLLHASLRRVLGPHVRQAGSLVTPDRLRFDFTHYRALTPEEQARVEELVNGWVQDDLPVVVEDRVPMSVARERGALAFFEEKYGDTVRVVSVPGVSMELCGGTHMDRTSRVGPMAIVAEGSVAAGVRRVEAVTGMALYRRAKDLESTLATLESLVGGEDVVERVKRMRERLKEAETQVAHLKAQEVLLEVERAMARAVEGPGVRIATALVPQAEKEALRAAADHVRDTSRTTVMVAATPRGDTLHLVVAVTDDLVAKGIHAGRLVQRIAQSLGGRGGGRAHLAEGGIPRPADAEALATLEQVVRLSLETP